MNGEVTDPTGLTAFTAAGFSVGALHSAVGGTYVAYCWKKQVGVFDIVSYAGNGAADRSIPHALGVVPDFIISHQYQALALQTWAAYHKSLGQGVLMTPNTTGAAQNIANYWGSTGFTALDYRVSADGNVNSPLASHIAYLWAEVPGIQSFGSYTGNGSADGPMVNMGLSPAMTIIRHTNAVEDWYLIDSKLNSYNPATNKLFPDLNVQVNSAPGNSAATNLLDHLAVGAKLRTSNSGTNQSSQTYIYAAWADKPVAITASDQSYIGTGSCGSTPPSKPTAWWMEF